MSFPPHFFLNLLLVLCLLSACSPPTMPTPSPEPLLDPTPLPASLTPPPPTPITPPITPPLDPQAQFMQRARQALQYLEAHDLAALAGMVHPSRGVRFSPYPFVLESDRVLLPADLPGALADPALYLWGAYDGTGDPIELSFNDYYAKFVWDHDYLTAPQSAINNEIGSGNSINNIAEFYPGASFVEFHFPGFNPDYGGMDWVSLRLVFVQEGEQWLLVGIIHCSWTI